MEREERFRLACEQAFQRERAGIGTLGEKTLHAALKNYYEPHVCNQEIRVGGYVADIVGGQGIMEIQTRSFDKLRKKLAAFLEVATVTVIYPIAAVKWLIWVDEATGEAAPRRKSPKKRGPWEVFPELYKIKPLLNHPNFRLRICLLELEETRWLNGWSRDRKKGASRCDQTPLALLDEVELSSPADYRVFLPAGLEKLFDSRDYQRATGLSLSKAQTALNVLYFVGAVERAGKSGNRYLYQRSPCCE